MIVPTRGGHKLTWQVDVLSPYMLDAFLLDSVKECLVKRLSAPCLLAAI